MAPSHLSPKKEDEDDDVQLWGESGASYVAPLPKIIQLEGVQIGAKVFAPEKSSLDPWWPAKVVEVYDNYGKRLIKVEFLLDERPKSVVRTRARSKEMTNFRSLTLKNLAYYEEAHIDSLPVGVRVIAQTVILANKPCTFYSGIVADTPKQTNKHRYLIFFDSGDARYIDPSNVRLICKYEPPVWADMHPNHQMFIKKYIEDYPDNAMATLRQAAHTSVEFNGCWWPARVLETDCFLVKLQFIQNDISFWVYRGSPRLLSNFVKTKKEALVPCTYFQEYEGKVVNHTVPEKYKKLGVPDGIPIPPHTCGPACSPSFPGDLTELNQVSPLVIPFYYGWKRDIDRNDQSVFYTTPCGKKLKSYKKIHKFVTKTDSPLQIDSFCLDSLVNCHAEFQPTRPILFREQDISNGKEAISVERVNSVDNVPPQPFEYISETNANGTETNADDPGFLVCCDCDNDCRDKQNCACFNLTFDMDTELAVWLAQDANNHIDMIGYQNKRLSEKHKGGVYECNSKCQCKSSCANRVVQNGIKWRLQVFKTGHKGYAVRAMQDIPEGAFLCTYAGLIMDTELANQKVQFYTDGSGTEYLAELDYIESVKEGYEETVRVPGSRELPKVKKPTTKKFCENLDTGNKFRKRFFGLQEDVYVVDAKDSGNIARYINHSCNPNTVAQHVFVDTHDIRFPLVAFFTKTVIKCGTELCWNYNYKAGSVSGVRIDCHCGAINCCERLL